MRSKDESKIDGDFFYSSVDVYHSRRRYLLKRTSKKTTKMHFSTCEMT